MKQTKIEIFVLLQTGCSRWRYSFPGMLNQLFYEIILKYIVERMCIYLTFYS